jgi:hypothetical protein
MAISSDPDRHSFPTKGNIKGVPFVENKDDWVHLSLMNMQAKVDRARGEAALSFVAGVFSAVIGVVILIQHFAH